MKLGNLQIQELNMFKQLPVQQYFGALQELFSMIQKARREAVYRANKLLIGLYWLIGQLINEKVRFSTWGENVQSKYIDNSPTTKAFYIAQHANWFEQRNATAPQQIYVLADSNCNACHYFDENIEHYIANNHLEKVALLRNKGADIIKMIGKHQNR